MKHKSTKWVLLSALILTGSTIFSQTRMQGNSSISNEKRKQIERSLTETDNNIWFQKNLGQLPSEVLYAFDTKFGAMFVYDDHLQLTALKKDHSYVADDKAEFENKFERHTVNMYFKGGNPTYTVEPHNQMVTQLNYIKGNDPSKWVSLAPVYGELLLKNVYDGIDLRLYSNNNGTVEFDWILDRAGDFAKIKMNLEGQDGLKTSEVGDLTLVLRMADIDFQIPESYQIINGEKFLVKAKYKLDGQDVIFDATGIKDIEAPMVIDPTVLWGTYFDANGTIDAYSFGVEIDSCGNAFVAATTDVSVTTSYRSNTSGGYDNSYNNPGAIIYEMNAAGTTILYFTYYDENDVFTDIGLFPDGRVIVAGFVGTSNSSYPAVNAYTTNTSANGVVAVLNSTLSSVLYSSRLPGSAAQGTIGISGTRTNNMGVTSIEVVGNNDYYLAGITNYTLSGFVSNTAVDQTRSNREAYITRFNGTNYNNKVWATYIGGDGDEYFVACKLDLKRQNICFTGYSNSSSNAGFPATTSGVVDNTWSGTESWAGVFTNSTSVPTAFQMLTYLGGSGNEERGVIDCDSNYMYIMGMSQSTDFPGTGVSGVYRGTHYFNNANTANYDLVITRLPIVGTTGFRSTYLGGTNNEFSGGIVFNTQDNQIYTFATTQNAGTTGGNTQFPTQNTNPPSNYFNSSHGGSLDISLGTMSADLTTLVYASLVGGSGNDYLGQTGNLLGAGHYDFNSVSNIYGLTTTVHSTLSTSFIPSSGFFDGSKSNGSDDVHILIKMNLSSYDIGDAPLSYEGGNLAKHGFNPATTSLLRLGSNEDAETGVVRNGQATGDDDAVSGVNQCIGTSGDDEDGVSSFPTLTVESTGTYQVTVATTNSTGSSATLHAWLDLNGDGKFSTAEYTSATVTNAQTSATLSWNLGGGLTCGSQIVGGRTYARLRLSSTTLIDTVGTTDVDERSHGIANNGEVEDYAVNVRGRDYGDLPVSYGVASAMVYGDIDQNYQPDDAGAVWLGTYVDIEKDCAANSSTNADGDDLEFIDDEDGLVLPATPIKQNTNYNFPLTFSRSTPGTTIHYGMWIDWNADGDFTDPTDGFYNGSTTLGSASVSVTSPFAAALSPYFAVRVIARTTALSSTDYAAVFNNGEIEDYINDPGLLISGTVYADGDGTYDGAVDGTPGSVLSTPSGTQLWAYLVNGSNVIVDSLAVNANGTYFLQGAAASTAYTVKISTTRAAIGATSPSVAIPTNWVNVGETYGVNNAAGAGIEALTPSSNGIVAVTTGTVAITGVDFGLDFRPESNDANGTSQPNPAGSAQYTVPSLTGTDNEQGALTSGAGFTIIIESLPGNADVYYNGNLVTSGQVIANYVAANLTVDPTFTGAGNVVFTYAWRDSAQQKDLSPATITMPFTDATVVVSGNVLDDGNGLNASPVNTVDGSGLGNPSSTTLYANLLNAAGTSVVATTTVNANGTYSFPTVNANTNYVIQISTNQGTVSSATPTTALPTNWVNTGENLGTGAGSDGSVDGLLSISVATSNITNANFGIDARPYSDSITMTAQANPGIGTYVTVSTLSGSDKEDGAKGSGNTLVITSLATNGTLRYNGSPVTLNQVITNYNPSLLQVTPNFSGAGTVTFTYAWRDAAGFDDLSPATVDVPFLGGISGTVYDDGNGLNAAPANTVDGTGLGNPSSTTLYANLLDATGSTVLATTTVNTNGTYSFSSLVAGNYQVQVSTNQGTISAATPATALPTNWVNTGENLGAGAGNDGTVNGILTGITLGTTAVSNANFGIDVRPYSDSITMTAQANPGIGTYVTVSTLSGSDKEDGAKGSGNTLVITSLATNGTLRYNGSPVTLNQVITNYNPSLLQVTPNFSGAGTVSFTYAWRDAAGFDDLSPATVDVPFLGGISGTVYDDGNGLNAAPANTVDGTGLGNPSSTTLYANLLDATGSTVLATTTVNTNGTYSFSSLVAGNYQVQVSTNQGTVSAATPATALPTNWVNTGENLGSGAGNDGTVNGILTGITLGTTAVSNANFGIDERPTSNNVSTTSQVNPGGTVQVQAPTLAGNDSEDGSKGTGNTFVITSLGVNGDVYYNGSLVTLNQVITSYDPTLLTVDPTFNGSGTVTFTYAWRDAAGFDDLTPATASVPFGALNISGVVHNDYNGITDNLVNGPVFGTVGSSQLWAYMLNASNTVVDSSMVNNTTGAFNFDVADANTTYSVVVSTTRTAVGTAGPSSSNLPGSWMNVGEAFGTSNNAGSGIESGTSNGIIAATTGTSDISNILFGIEYGTVAEDKTYAVAPDSIKGLTGLPLFTHFIFLNHPSGTVDGIFSSASPAVKPGQISGFDEEEGRFNGATGSVMDTAILTTLPDTNNAVLVYRYNGQNIFLWPTPSSGDPSWQWWNTATSQYEIPNLEGDSLILFFKFAYQLTTSFQYAYVDASGLSGPLATYQLSYTVPLPVVMGELMCSTKTNGNSVSWKVIDGRDLQEMKVFRSFNGEPFVAIATIAYDFVRESKEYSFLDKDAGLGYSMYKVVATSIDGTSHSTNVCALSNNSLPASVKITVSPNPTNGVTSMLIVTPEENVFTVDVRDNLGRILQTQIINITGTVKSTDIDLSAYVPGIYNVRISWNGNTQVVKVLKQ